MAPPRHSAEELFWRHVDRGDVDACWLWTASTVYGYGKFGAQGRTIRAHRFAYELLVGPIPAGLGIDHRCHTRDGDCLGGATCAHRRCCNPAHLAPATQRANNARSRSLTADRLRWTACPSGHAYTPENTYIDPRGKRNCRSCRAAATRRWKQRRAA